MEKGPSVYAEYWTSERNEVDHFNSHGKQMGYENKIRDYSQAAKDFILNDSPDKLSFTGVDQTICMYNPKTNEFAKLSREGKIITYFPPSKGIDYFYKQFDKYGDYWN